MKCEAPGLSTRLMKCLDFASPWLLSGLAILLFYVIQSRSSQIESRDSALEPLLIADQTRFYDQDDYVNDLVRELNSTEHKPERQTPRLAAPASPEN